MSQYITVVVRVPNDDDGKKTLHAGLDAIKPFQTAMSLEDEMTVLELIEQHNDFDGNIADEARTKTKELHATSEAVA